MSFFVPGVPPPKSKYSYAELGLQSPEDDENDDIDNFCNFDSDSDDEGKLMFSSAADYIQTEPNDVVEANENENEIYKAIYTSQEWLDQIEEHYFNERDDLVRQTLQTALENISDPYDFVVHIMHRGFFDLYSKRLPVTFFALDELCVWLDLKELNKEPVPEPSESNKKNAAEFLCHSGYNYLDKLNKVFHLDQGENSYLADSIQLDNLKCKKLKETVIIIYTLRLQHCFDLEEILIPLIEKDQLQVLEIYVGNDTKLQNGYLKLLDKLCSMKKTEIENVIRKRGLQLKDPSKMQHKTLIKLADKALKRYGLNPDDYPNIFASKNISSLFYLIRMRIEEKEKRSSNEKLAKWDELIEAAVDNKLWLQKKLVDRLVELNEHEIAMFWVRRLIIRPSDVPRVLMDHYSDYDGIVSEELKSNTIYSRTKKHIDQQQLGAMNNDVEELRMRGSDDDDDDQNEDLHREGLSQDSEDWDSEIENNPGLSFSIKTGFSSGEEQEDFLELNLPTESISIVDTLDSLKEMSKVLFKDGNVIGFDAEWKPTMCRAGESEYASILQLALTDQIFILDLKTLYVTHGSEEMLKQFFFRFFTSKTVIKVGYGITGDLKILIGMFSYAREFILNASCLVDLCELSGKIIPHHLVMPNLFLPIKAAITERGLSMLVTKTLGKPLNKTFQVSDWERRPLSRSQIHYAALDAHCLLEVYNVLCNFNNKYNIKVNVTGNVRLKWLKAPTTTGKRKDKYEKREDKEKMPIPDNKPLFKGTPRPSTSLKVICDTMLQGLGRQLRNCGVDTLILENTEDHSTAVQISHRDKRVILTRGKPFFMMRGHVGEGMCMWVPDGTLKEQVKMVFTKYHIVLRSEDVLSRCSICNSDSYTKVHSEDMKLAFELKHDVGESEMPENQRTQSGEINLGNFSLTKSGVELQLELLSFSSMEKAKQDNTLGQLFETVQLFYICNGCGKVFWEGSHHAKVRNNFSELIDKREKDQYYYGKPG